MGLFTWFTSRGRPANGGVPAWHRAWREALAGPDAARADALGKALDALGLPDDDIEIEREMLDGLRRLLELEAAVEAGGLPAVVTGHRVIGSEPCHFSAPVSVPDDAAQPAGRLLLTSTRAIFVGGGRTASVPWHAVIDARHAERDVVLVTADRRGVHRFRCNTFADALCGAFLGRRLAASRRARPAPSSGARP